MFGDFSKKYPIRLLDRRRVLCIESNKHKTSTDSIRLKTSPSPKPTAYSCFIKQTKFDTATMLSVFIYLYEKKTSSEAHIEWLKCTGSDGRGLFWKNPGRPLTGEISSKTSVKLNYLPQPLLPKNINNDHDRNINNNNNNNIIGNKQVLIRRSGQLVEKKSYWAKKSFETITWRSWHRNPICDTLFYRSQN